MPLSQRSAAASRFAIGSAAVVRSFCLLGHTRCPRDVRGKRGVVVRVDGLSLLPDVGAHASERCNPYAYNVRFNGRALWGDARRGEGTVRRAVIIVCCAVGLLTT